MGKQFPCNNCGLEIKWPDNYQQGQKPVNLDGSTHVHGQASGQQSLDKTEEQKNQGTKLEKFKDIDKLDEMLYQTTKTRLQKVMTDFGVPELKPEHFQNGLVFIESWSRTLAQALR